MKDRKAWKKPFLLMWIPESASQLAAGMTQFALIWFLASTSNSAMNVSLALAVILIPKAVLNPLLGAAVDRFDRKSIMIIARIVVSLCSVTLFLLFLAGSLLPVYIYIVLFFRSTVDTCHNKAMASSISLMVPGTELTRIAGLTQALSGIIMVVSPAIGALLLKTSTITAIVSLDFFGAVGALTPLLYITIPRLERIIPKAERNIFRTLLIDCRDGLRYLRNWPGALGMLCLSAAVTFIMQPYFGLIAVLVRGSMHKGEVEYGMLGASVGAGFFIGGCLLSVWQGFHRKMLTVLLGIAGAGIFVFLSGWMITAGFMACVPCFFAAGIMMPLCMGPIQALVQSSVEKNMQGRILSIMECVSSLAAPVAVLLAGMVFTAFGPWYWYAFGGMAAIGVAVYGFCNSRIRNLGGAVER